MTRIFTALLFITFLASCTSFDKPKIVRSDSESSDTLSLKEDTGKIKMADLPLHIDSTSYLLHPIGEFQVRNERGKIFSGSASYSGSGFSVSRSGSYGITGNLSNIMFQSITSNKLMPLTKSPINITEVAFLKEMYRQNKSQILVYELNDKDTNQDQKLDNNDIKTLYLSMIDGAGFKKLSGSNHELLDWKLIPIASRLYFKTIEDTNKDGGFDEKDTVHYQYVDLSTAKFEVIEYYPI